MRDSPPFAAAAVRACGPHGWWRRIVMVASHRRPPHLDLTARCAVSSPRGCGAACPRPHCRPPRPDPTTRRPPFAASPAKRRAAAALRVLHQEKPLFALRQPRGGEAAAVHCGDHSCWRRSTLPCRERPARRTRVRVEEVTGQQAVGMR